MGHNEGSPKREVYIINPKLKIKLEKFCINNLMIHPKPLEKQEQQEKGVVWKISSKSMLKLMK